MVLRASYAQAVGRWGWDYQIPRSLKVHWSEGGVEPWIFLNVDDHHLRCIKPRDRMSKWKGTSRISASKFGNR
ncbi:MAG: hypothetical protein ACFE9C_18015 [Candidatus Hodarchaeota archaeon]